MHIARHSACGLLLLLGSVGCEGSPPAQEGCFPAEPLVVARDKPAAKKYPIMYVVRLPKGGTHPQALRSRGGLNVLYFQGEPGRGDVYYIKTGTTPPDFSKPLRVNARAGSAALDGAAHGPQFALDTQGRAHIVWMEPGAAGEADVCYARAKADGSGLELQRKIAGGVGLRGGAVGANAGMVSVFWLAPDAAAGKQDGHRVWYTAFLHSGQTIVKPAPISPPEREVCAASGLSALTTYPGMPVVLYRAATDAAHRDLYLLHEDRRKMLFFEANVHAWQTKTCPPTTGALQNVHNGYVAAWETAGQIYFTRIPSQTAKIGAIHAMPGAGARSRPAVANDGRDTALVWLEKKAAGQPLAVRWQVFDYRDRPTAEAGEAPAGVPAGSHAVVVPFMSGLFYIIY